MVFPQMKDLVGYGDDTQTCDVRVTCAKSKLYHTQVTLLFVCSLRDLCASLKEPVIDVIFFKIYHLNS